MPLYAYHCCNCGYRGDLRSSVEDRDYEYGCPGCEDGRLRRVFAPTRNIWVDEHFRHLQSDLLPSRDDKKGWEMQGSKEWDSQRHDPEEGPSLKEHLTGEFLTREKITLTSG